ASTFPAPGQTGHSPTEYISLVVTAHYIRFSPSIHRGDREPSSGRPPGIELDRCSVRVRPPQTCHRPSRLPAGRTALPPAFRRRRASSAIPHPSPPPGRLWPSLGCRQLLGAWHRTALSLTQTPKPTPPARP